MEPLDEITKQQCEQEITMTLKVYEALGLLATLQLALRHPNFHRQPTAVWIKQYAEDLQKQIVSKAPKLRFLCDAGWNPKFDR